MSNRQEKTAYEFTNYKPISVHKKVYDELTDLSNNIYDVKLSYANLITDYYYQYDKDGYYNFSLGWKKLEKQQKGQ